ncbi:MAG: hypothetical protein GY941_00280 [Planctomycetes bacterium]|nr:hypothetical protein [Planctomycetota bacterium]
MIVDVIRAELANRSSRPKGMKITIEVYKELEAQGLVERKEFDVLAAFGLGPDLPFFEGDIFLYIDPVLETRSVQFEMPS